jgi:hypothetical protein
MWPSTLPTHLLASRQSGIGRGCNVTAERKVRPPSVSPHPLLMRSTPYAPWPSQRCDVFRDGESQLDVEAGLPAWPGWKSSRIGAGFWKLGLQI